MQIETQYSSEGKSPNGEPFLTVKKSRGYYEYSQRPGYDSVTFILYDSNSGSFALINESKPPLDERMNKLVQMTTAFGGSIDMNKTYKEICQIEVREESGYVVPLNKIYSIGKTLVSSQMSQLCEGFLVDVTNIEKTLEAEHEVEREVEHEVEREVEGEKNLKKSEFSKNSIVWMDISEVMENDDWKSIWILSKSIHLGLI